ncbi:endoribonuclease SymE [Atlantibacter hermannii]|uniref:endoribonuclease SymE n=1 Tax=Atlantibacter hermannii TaxID=565 RepID=UPI002FDB7625
MLFQLSSNTEVSPTNYRRLTVSYTTRNPDYARITALIMRGQWLETAGFTTGTKMDVKVLEGCTVLTAQPVSPEEPELLKSLRKVCKLSARK